MSDSLVAPYTPNTVRNIRRNAGKLPPEKLAADLGWTQGRLHTVARLHEIDLRLIPAEDPGSSPLSASFVARQPVLSAVRIYPDVRPMIAGRMRAHRLNGAEIVNAALRAAFRRGLFDELVNEGRDMPHPANGFITP